MTGNEDVLDVMELMNNHSSLNQPEVYIPMLCFDSAHLSRESCLSVLLFSAENCLLLGFHLDKFSPLFSHNSASCAIAMTHFCIV